jgi:hypothetical protein
MVAHTLTRNSDAADGFYQMVFAPTYAQAAFWHSEKPTQETLNSTAENRAGLA